MQALKWTEREGDRRTAKHGGKKFEIKPNPRVSAPHVGMKGYDLFVDGEKVHTAAIDAIAILARVALRVALSDSRPWKTAWRAANAKQRALMSEFRRRQLAGGLSDPRLYPSFPDLKPEDFLDQAKKGIHPGLPNEYRQHLFILHLPHWLEAKEKEIERENKLQDAIDKQKEVDSVPIEEYKGRPMKEYDLDIPRTFVITAPPSRPKNAKFKTLRMWAEEWRKKEYEKRKHVVSAACLCSKVKEFFPDPIRARRAELRMGEILLIEKRLEIAKVAQEIKLRAEREERERKESKVVKPVEIPTNKTVIKVKKKEKKRVGVTESRNGKARLRADTNGRVSAAAGKQRRAGQGKSRARVSVSNR